MTKTKKEIKRWENPKAPAAFERECFPPLGITRLLPHHFVWWAQPVTPTYCCGCCCGKNRTESAQGCSINLELEPNTFGPGKSIHILVVVTPYQYFAEFYLTWTATGAGQVTVDLELTSGPASGRQLLADNRGPTDRYLFSTNQPGRYLFRATVTDSQGNKCFDTLQVDLPSV